MQDILNFIKNNIGWILTSITTLIGIVAGFKALLKPKAKVSIVNNVILHFNKSSVPYEPLYIAIIEIVNPTEKPMDITSMALRLTDKELLGVEPICFPDGTDTKHFIVKDGFLQLYEGIFPIGSIKTESILCPPVHLEKHSSILGYLVWHTSRLSDDDKCTVRVRSSFRTYSFDLQIAPLELPMPDYEAQIRDFLEL